MVLGRCGMFERASCMYNQGNDRHVCSRCAAEHRLATVSLVMVQRVCCFRRIRRCWIFARCMFLKTVCKGRGRLRPAARLVFGSEFRRQARQHAGISSNFGGRNRALLCSFPEELAGMYCRCSSTNPCTEEHTVQVDQP